MVKIPILKGMIDRRVLVNFTADPAVVQKLLPPLFRPRPYNGKAIVGVCLIRLKQIRPKGLPASLGISSENAAHRIAVEWNENDQHKQGVYIPRRDTSSVLNRLAGGRIFPGRHYRADFKVNEENGTYDISYQAKDETRFSMEGAVCDSFDNNSIFGTLEQASDFFKAGNIGYTPGSAGFDGLDLKTYTWKVRPLHVQTLSSSFFDSAVNFPAGSVRFDHALLMHEIEHEWKSLGRLCG